MARPWLFLAAAGLLTAGLSGHPSPAPSSPPSPGRAESQPSEPGPVLAGPRPEVRLANGSSGCRGAVEVRAGASWEAPCAELWDRRASEAACHALGCGGAEPGPDQPTPPPLDRAPGNASGTPNATWAPAPVVRCSGSEWRLCRVEQRPCSRAGPPAQVTCAEPQDLRLADGGGRCAGRVELLERGQWGSLCDDAWGLEDAHVVCRQLGCGWAVRAVPGLHFPPGRGPVHRDLVNCSGAEARLRDCPGRPGEGYCGHKEDAGVVCSEHQTLRLSGGADRCEGQVEVHFRGVWSSVCDSEWYQSEARVLCRALGCGTAAEIPRGPPHALPGRMYYSCHGDEATLSDCRWRFNNSNLCSQSKAARVLCSGSRKLLNESTSDLPTSAQPATTGPAGPAPSEDWTARELALLVPCAVLGALLLGALAGICVLLLRAKGKYALPSAMTPQHRPAAPAGVNSYQEVPKEEAPQLPVQAPAPAPAPADSDCGSDSDYEHYDFSAQPPVALTTFYNSQRYRVTEEEAQQSRFRMPPVEEDPPSRGPPQPARSSSGSSTSSGEGYCNSPRRQPPPPPWGPLGEQPPRLELAGSQGTFSGPSADDGSSTSSGEWYQNFQPPPLPPPPPEELCGGPGSPSPRPASTDEDYDDIGAA